MRYLVTTSYDGSNYNGFQKQNNGIGIQEEIEKAFKLMTQTEITIHSAGRTDKGVHAIGQAFHFESDLNIQPQTWVRLLNSRLPSDIRITSVKEVSSDFHARFSAKKKIYHYYIAKKPSTPFNSRYEVYKELNIKKVKEAAKYLVGTHDFKGFSKLIKGKPTIKTLYKLKIRSTKKHYIFEFEGNSFLRYMIRSIMGTLIEIGENKKDPLIIKEILETKERKLAGKTAEAKGLFLVKIFY